MPSRTGWRSERHEPGRLSARSPILGGSKSDRRCPAAHVADPRLCEGVIDAVQIVDQAGASVAGCLLHGAVLLASLDRGRVYPLNGPDGSAITVFTRAQTLQPFDFLVRSPRGPAAHPAAVRPAVRRVDDTDGAVAGRDA